MRIKKVCKLCIDIGMLVITLLLMASERTGIVLHMFLGGGFVHLICCSQYFKSGMVGRHWQGIVQPDEVGENHIECVAAH